MNPSFVIGESLLPGESLAKTQGGVMLPHYLVAAGQKREYNAKFQLMLQAPFRYFKKQPKNPPNSKMRKPC